MEERLYLTSIFLKVRGAQIEASVTGTLTSGMVGIPVTIEYDEAWEGLTKNLVCRCSGQDSGSTEQRAILNVGNTAVVAHEVMQAGKHLWLGVEGYNADGTLVIPTAWAVCQVIKNGANTGEDLSADPTLPVWSQLQREIEQIKEEVVTPEQMTEILSGVQSAVQAAAIYAGRAEAAAKRAEEAANGQNPNYGGGLSAAAKEALMAVVEAVGVWEHPDPQELIDNLRNALYNAPVAAISAVYTQSRTVYTNDALDVLRNDLVVTAAYTDGSSAVRTDYTLSGVLTAGVSTITATLDGKTATFEVQVAAARIPATGITLSSTALSITAGDSVRLTATVEPADSTDTVVWESTEEAVAAVAQDGTVTPVANGSCKIIATAGDVRAECSVAVSLPLVGYNYGNPYLNYVDSDPTTLGKTDEELRGKWYSAQFTSWGTSLGLTSRIFLHPFGPGTHYIRYVNRILDPMLDFYAFANADIVSNPTMTLGKVGADGSNSGASVTRIGAFDNCELNDNDAYGRPNIGKWTTVDGSNAEVQEGFLSLFIMTVPEGEYVFMGASEVVVANRIPGYSDKYPINDWYTIFADDPSGNILQIAREA